MSRRGILGLDIGTTGVKALILAVDSGEVLARGYCAYESVTGPVGEHEQSPEDWWSSVRVAVSQARHDLHDISVDAIGLSGHMHGSVLIDAHDQVVRPATTWADRRSSDNVRKLSVDSRFQQHCVNPVVEAFTAPQLAWFREHEPERLALARRLVHSKDYVRFRLTGVWATDHTDACGTLLYDLIQGSWVPELWHEVGVAPDLAADVLESHAVAGALTSSAAADLGLPPGVPVVAGAGDVSASALGAGVLGDGVVYINAGTAVQVVAALARPESGAHFVFGRADSRGLLGMASVYAAGLAIDWAARLLLGPTATGADVESHALSSRDYAVTFLPYLLGTSVPSHNPDVRGAFVGLGAVHDARDLARAVIAGVALATVEATRYVEGLSQQTSQIRVGGGLARSTLWTHMVAACFDQDMVQVETDSSPTGAAILAGVGTGIWSSFEDAAQRCIRVRHVAVDAQMREEMATRTGHFHATAQALIPEHTRTRRVETAS